MALVVKDRVRETSSSTGTGTFTLSGAVNGFQSFSVIGDGNTTYYAIIDLTNNEWEVGVGTYTSSGTTLSRDTILESTNGGSAVNFSAGVKDVFCTYPAERSVDTELIQTLNNKTLASPTITGDTTINAQGDLRFADADSSNYVAFQAPATVTTNVLWTLPAADGSANQVLKTDGSGNLGWVTPNAGTVTSVDVSGGTTGLTTSGGPVTSSGTVTLAGTLNVANGGTGAATLTANNVILGNGTSAVQFVAPGTNGNVLTSNGTTWTSAAAGASLSGQTDTGTPFETSLGSGAGAVSTGVNNTFIGYEAGNDNTTGTNNTAVGFSALDVNTTGARNTAIGANALGGNTTGQNNTAIGSTALFANTTGQGGVAIGRNSLTANTTGFANVAIGADSSLKNVDGNYNVSIGYQSANENVSGINNISIGYNALYFNTSSDNTAVGKESGDGITTGTQNTLIGSNSASSGTNDLTTGSNNIVIGYNAAASSGTVSNEITFGNSSITKLRIPGISIDWDANLVPFRNIPQNSQSAAYTLVASDSGKHILHPSADTTARTFTIPANGSVPFPIGTAVTFINQNGAGVVTIAITTDTMRLAGAGTTGSRTLAANGVATAIKITSTEWIISGTGLT